MTKSPKTVAIIQARMGSSRLSGKVMQPIAGVPMIDHVVRRTKRVGGIDEVVVATSTHEREQPLVDRVSSMDGVGLYRGPEDDVLRRYYEAAVERDAEAVVRITGDCPLLSPRISTRVVDTYQKCADSFDYVTNTLARTFPRGLDTAAFGFDALERAHRCAESRSEREHVTVHIWSNPGEFRLLNIADAVDRHHLRWTVDTHRDLLFVRRVYDALYRSGEVFEYEKVLELLERSPELTGINAGVRQKPVDR